MKAKHEEMEEINNTIECAELAQKISDFVLTLDKKFTHRTSIIISKGNEKLMLSFGNISPARERQYVVNSNN